MTYYIAQHPRVFFLFNTFPPGDDRALPGEQVNAAIIKLRDYFECDPTSPKYAFRDLGWPHVYSAAGVDLAARAGFDDLVDCLKQHLKVAKPTKPFVPDVDCPDRCICRPAGNLHQTTCYLQINGDGDLMILPLKLEDGTELDAYVSLQFDLLDGSSSAGVGVGPSAAGGRRGDRRAKGKSAGRIKGGAVKRPRQR